jgi:Putative Flp pilus-assembly TadE/G-like
LRGRRHDQSGNILVMFAILLPLITFTAAVVIDVGYWWANARKAQIAADACALAAAKELPAPSGGWNLAECKFNDTDYVVENLPPQGPGSEPEHVSTQVISPFQGNATQVEAIVRLKVRTFFGRFIGLSGVDLQRRAVAEQAVGQGNYAIYAHSAGCPANGTGTALLFNGMNHSINGRVHSNGEYRVNNQPGPPPDFAYFWAQHGTMDGCFTDNPPGSAHFGGTDYSHHTSTTPTDVGPQTWPAWWTPAEFGWSGDLNTSDTCDVKGKSIKIKEDSGRTLIEVANQIGSSPAGGLGPFNGTTLPHAYVYCATEKVELERPGLTGQMTVLAPEISVKANNMNLTAYKGTAAGNMLFFAVPNIDAAGTQFDGAFPAGNPVCDSNFQGKELLLNTHNSVWDGIIFAPCIRAHVNGDNNSGNGTMLGWEVEVNGANFEMTGDSNFGGTVILSLDQ